MTFEDASELRRADRQGLDVRGHLLWLEGAQLGLGSNLVPEVHRDAIGFLKATTLKQP